MLSLFLREYISLVLESDHPAWRPPRQIVEPKEYEGFKSYYNVDPNNPPSLKEVARLWAQEKKKMRDLDEPLWYPVRELLPFREYEWKRELARLSSEEWDDLKEKIKQGWKKGSWLTVNIFRNGTIQIGEGNHRLTMAHELGWENVPVKFWFRS